MADFMMMNGHGPYVWASYAITFLVLATLVIVPSLKKKQLIKRFERQQRIEVGAKQ